VVPRTVREVPPVSPSDQLMSQPVLGDVGLDTADAGGGQSRDVDAELVRQRRSLGGSHLAPETNLAAEHLRFGIEGHR